MAMLSDELDPQERLKFKQKAYDKFLNINQPAAAAQRGVENTAIAKKGMQDIYSGLQQGGYTGRQAASQAVDTSQLELAKSIGQQQQEQDALNVKGAGMKEDIIGAREANAMNAFKIQTKDMEDSLNKAVAERAFELQMTGKELAFHTNSAVADLGLEKMKKDYDAGNISKLELQTIANNLTRAAAASKMQADNALKALQDLGTRAATAESRKRGLELTLAMLEKQKKAAKDQAKAANIASMITGGATVIGAGIGGIYGGPVGASTGAAIGGAAGTGISKIDF